MKAAYNRQSLAGFLCMMLLLALSGFGSPGESLGQLFWAISILYILLITPAVSGKHLRPFFTALPFLALSHFVGNFSFVQTTSSLAALLFATMISYAIHKRIASEPLRLGISTVITLATAAGIWIGILAR